MQKKEILLPEKRYYQSPSEDLVTSIGFQTTEELLREGDKTIILDLERLFYKERNESKNYKIYGKLKMIFRNLYLGNVDNYANLQEYLYLYGDGSDRDFTGYLPYDEFAFIRKDVYRAVASVPVITDANIGTYSPTFALPTQIPNKHQEISMMDASSHNWNLYLSYVYSHDENYPITYTLTGGTQTVIGNVSGNGIPCRVEDKVGYYKLTCPVPHGISENEFVIIGSKVCTISSLGDEFFDSSKYVINLNKQQFSGTTLSTIVTIKRCVDKDNVVDTTSKYYVHKHKVLTTPDSCVIDKAGFETPIFEDEKKLLFENSAGINDFLVERNRMESVLFDFKDTFVLTGLTNNLGYTPSEIYVSAIFRNGSGYFDYPPKVGFKFNFHDTWIDAHFSGATSYESSLTKSAYTRSGMTFYTGNTLSVGDVLTGAFVEYNESELKERIISESFHKFTIPTTIFDHNQDDHNYYSGATLSNKVGLYYQPHYRLKLRELSPYVETYDTNNILDLPDNAKFFPKDELWKWRDVYDHGYVDVDGNGTDYPFINGQHYIKSDLNFYLRNEAYYTNKTDGIKGFGPTDC